MKKLICCLLCIIISLSFVGCSSIYSENTDSTKSTNNSKQMVESYSSLNYGSIYTYVDSETGINYLIYINGRSQGAGMSPRYNTDGSLMITK